MDIAMAMIGIASAMSLFLMSDFPKLIALAVNKILFDEDLADSLK